LSCASKASSLGDRPSKLSPQWDCPQAAFERIRNPIATPRRIPQRRQAAYRGISNHVHAPELNREESEQAQERSAVGAHVLHEAIRKEAEDELARPATSLAWSGLAAGLSMGFSLVAQGLLRSHLPDTEWRPLIEKLGYSVGFLIVILGRQQLFTENTLTPILSLFTRRDLPTLANVARLWGIVLVTNLLGALIFALVVAHTAALPPDAKTAFTELGNEAVRGSFGGILLRAIFSGWLIALLVWLLPGAETARVPVIVLMTFLVGLGQFPHAIAGAIEVLYVVSEGDVSIAHFLGGYLVPTLIGNIIGGVVLVAALNYAQSATGDASDPAPRSRSEVR
jgi:formate-nitrite transporter family protein